jgi:hypothetical protein
VASSDAFQVAKRWGAVGLEASPRVRECCSLRTPRARKRELQRARALHVLTHSYNPKHGGNAERAGSRVRVRDKHRAYRSARRYWSPETHKLERLPARRRGPRRDRARVPGRGADDGRHRRLHPRRSVHVRALGPVLRRARPSLRPDIRRARRFHRSQGQVAARHLRVDGPA